MLWIFLHNPWKTPTSFILLIKLQAECSLELTFSCILPYQHFNSDQRCFKIVDHRSNNVDSTLKMKQNPESNFQSCITLMQCRVQHWNTLNQRCTTSMKPFFQCCTMTFQRFFDVNMSLSQRCFKVASTSVKAISKSIWLKISMDLQRIYNFYSNKLENVLYNILTI